MKANYKIDESANQVLIIYSFVSAPQVCAHGDVIETVYGTQYYKAVVANCEYQCKDPQNSFQNSPLGVASQHYSKGTFLQITPKNVAALNVIHVSFNVTKVESVTVLLKKSNGDQVIRNNTVSYKIDVTLYIASFEN